MNFGGDIRFNPPPKSKETEIVRETKKPARNRFLLALFLILALALVGFFSIGLTDNPYKAFFLTNGQVYFGQVKKQNRDFIILENVFYLQENKNEESAGTETAPEKMVLTKLGGEIYGPKNEIAISRGQLLFYQVLREDSKVLGEIVKGGEK